MHLLGALQIHQFWHDLEVATNDKHQQLIGILNVHLDSLARDVEQVVGAALNLRLEPLDIQLDPPNAQQFHKSIQELFDTGENLSLRSLHSSDMQIVNKQFLKKIEAKSASLLDWRRTCSSFERKILMTKARSDMIHDVHDAMIGSLVKVDYENEASFCSGIGRNTRTEKESREEEYTVWETRYRGLCRTTEYYVGIPAKRRVEFDKEVTTFQLNSDSIKVSFLPLMYPCILAQDIREAALLMFSQLTLLAHVLEFLQ